MYAVFFITIRRRGMFPYDTTVDKRPNDTAICLRTVFNNYQNPYCIVRYKRSPMTKNKIYKEEFLNHSNIEQADRIILVSQSL